MLIQVLYILTDYQMEEQLGYNFMFMRFYHLRPENPVPDHSTIRHWHTRFPEVGLQVQLLAGVSKQISAPELTL